MIKIRLNNHDMYEIQSNDNCSVECNRFVILQLQGCGLGSVSRVV